jgi:hypothetical protein
VKLGDYRLLSYPCHLIIHQLSHHSTESQLMDTWGKTYANKIDICTGNIGCAHPPIRTSTHSSVVAEKLMNIPGAGWGGGINFAQRETNKHRAIKFQSESNSRAFIRQFNKSCYVTIKSPPCLPPSALPLLVANGNSEYHFPSILLAK